MRVGLRRLRAAISLFAPLFGDKQTERIKFELKWLAEELAPARDLDVYLKNEVRPLRRTTSAKRGMDELADAVASRRAEAFRKARSAVASPRYRSLLLDTLQWLENGDWAKHSGRPGRQNIQEFVADILSRRTKKASKNATKLRKLNSRQRHKLRIAMKKLRYASDFFGHLFCGRKARRRLSSFRVHLKDLQDHLGALNDITVHQRLAPKLAAEMRSTVAPRRAFAAGVVSGHEQSELKAQLRAVYKDSRKFAKIRAFWT